MKSLSHVSPFILCGLLLQSQLVLAEPSPGFAVHWTMETEQSHFANAKHRLLRLNDRDVTNAIGIAAGDSHLLVLLSSGEILASGNNKFGQAFGGSGEIIGWVPTTNGKAFRFESTYQPSGDGLVSLGGRHLTGITRIEAGINHNVALSNDGEVHAWGANYASEKYTLPAAFGTVKMAACGRDADWLLLLDGSVLELRQGQMRKVTGLTNVIEIAATKHDRSRIVALQADGLVCAGSVREGMRALHDLGSDVVSIAAGGWQILALRVDGRITASGGHVPDGLANITAVAVGERHSLALKADGTVVSWGQLKSRATIVPMGLSHVVAVAAGNDFSLAITTNAAVAERFRR